MLCASARDHPRGGGTGFAGAAVPVDGGVVVALERLARVRSFEPHWWRAEVESGLSTANVGRLARESGLLFARNPGAAEQSQIGGYGATNAGGTRAFKHGVTGRWVTGLEVVVAPGELVRLGGATGQDVAGDDLRSLFVGPEGTLGIITAIWLRFVPAPERTHSAAAFYPDAAAGCERAALAMPVTATCMAVSCSCRAIRRSSSAPTAARRTSTSLRSHPPGLRLTRPTTRTLAADLRGPEEDSHRSRRPTAPALLHPSDVPLAGGTQSAERVADVLLRWLTIIPGRGSATSRGGCS